GKFPPIAWRNPLPDPCHTPSLPRRGRPEYLPDRAGRRFPVQFFRPGYSISGLVPNSAFYGITRLYWNRVNPGFADRLPLRHTVWLSGYIPMLPCIFRCSRVRCPMPSRCGPPAFHPQLSGQAPALAPSVRQQNRADSTYSRQPPDYGTGWPPWLYHLAFQRIQCPLWHSLPRFPDSCPDTPSLTHRICGLFHERTIARPEARF